MPFDPDRLEGILPVRSPMILAAAALLAVLPSGCTKPVVSEATDGWVRLSAAPGRPAAAYLTVHGGPTDAVLISITSPLAIRAEMHETMAMGPARAAATTMRPIAQLALPANGTLAFAPGARHVMLFDVNPAVKPGGSVPLELTFADGSRLETRAQAVAAGAPAPVF